MKYQRISLEERIKIYHLIQLNTSFREIGRQLNRLVSSISIEVRGIKGRKIYNPVLQQKK